MIVFNWMKGGNFTLQSQEICVTPSGLSPCYILQGDNYYDTTVHLRDMHEDNQNKSLHYFNTYAVKDKPKFYKMHSTDNSLPADIESAPKSTFLPTMVDCKAIRDNYTVLIASLRVLTEYLTFLHPLKQCVPSHILHEYSSFMSQKSEIVSAINNNYFKLINAAQLHCLVRPYESFHTLNIHTDSNNFLCTFYWSPFKFGMR